MLEQILADLVVGVVLLRAAIFNGGLHLKVGHEGRAGYQNQALAVLLFHGHHEQTLIVFRGSVLGNRAAQTVAVGVLGVGAAVTEDHGAYAGRQCAAGSLGIDGAAAVVAEDLSVQTVVGILRIHLDAGCQEVFTVGIKVQTLGLAAVQAVIVGSVIADAQDRAQCCQQLVLLRRHMILGGECGVMLIVIGPAGQDYRAALAVKVGDGGDLCVTVCSVRITELTAVTAGGSGENEHGVLGIAAGRDQLLAGLQLNSAGGVFRSKRTEVAHAVLVVAGHIFVVVGGVDADVDQAVGIENVKRDLLGKGVILAVMLYHHGGGDGHDLGHVGRVLEVHSQRAGGGERIAGGVGSQNHGAVGGVGDGLDQSVSRLAVEEGGGQGQLLPGDGSGGAAFQRGDAQLQALANPDRGGNGQVAVALGDADVVVAVAGVKLHGQGAGGKLTGIVPGIDALAGVDDNLNLGDGVGGVGVVDGDIDIQLFGDNGDAGAHHQIIDGVADLQILVLGSVHAHGAHGLVKTLFAEVFGDDNVAGVVGVAPLALVVILVVGGSHMPALIQSHGVVLIAGIVAAGANLTLAVADFDQEDAAVNHRIPVGKIAEGAEGGAGVVELAQAVLALRLAQQGVIGLHAGIAGLVIQGGVVAGDDAGGVEGVDVAGAAGPGHLKAGNGNDIRLGGVESSHSVLIGLPGLLAVRGGQTHVVERALRVGGAGLVEVVGVVGEGHKVHVGVLRQVPYIVKSRVERTGAVGVGGVGVELAEVELIAGSAHGEGPGLAGFLAVSAFNGYGDGSAAVGHIGVRRIADHTVFIFVSDRLVVDSHGDLRLFTRIGHLGGDDGALVLAGLAARVGRQVGEYRLVQHGNLCGAAEFYALGIHAGDRDSDRFLALKQSHGNGESINAVILRKGKAVLLQLDLGLALNAEYGVNGEAQTVIQADIGVLDRAEHDLGLVDDALSNVGVLSHGVEVHFKDRGVRALVGPAGEGAAEVLNADLGAAAAGEGVLGCLVVHHIADGLFLQIPLGIVVKGIGQEQVLCVVDSKVLSAGFKAVITAADRDGEHAAAVSDNGLAGFNGGRDAGHGSAQFVLQTDDALSGGVVDNHLIAGLGQTALGGLALFLDHQIELLGKEGLVAADATVSAPVVLIFVPLNEKAAASILYVKAVGGIGSGNVPVRILLVQRHAGKTVCHCKFLSFSGGEGIAAVAVHAYGPDFGGAITREFSVTGRDINARVIVSTISLGQGFHVGRVEDDDLGPVGQLTEIGDNVVFLLHMGLDLAGQSIAELERIVDAHSHRDVDLVAHGVFPSTVNLVDDGLVELDGFSLSVLDRDVGGAVSAVLIVDLGDLQAGELHIGADVSIGQRTDGRGLGRQGQAGGLLIGCPAQLGKAIVGRTAAGGDDGVAQADVGGFGAHASADAAGLILKIDVLAVYQGHNALDGEAGSFRAGQGFSNGIILGHDFGNPLAHQLVESHTEGIYVT